MLLSCCPAPAHLLQQLLLAVQQLADQRAHSQQRLDVHRRVCLALHLRMHNTARSPVNAQSLLPAVCIDLMYDC